MSVQQTSLEAYYDDSDGLRSQMRRYVYDIIARNPGISDKDVSKIAGVEINRITPRRNELVKFGIVRACGTKYNHYGRRVNIWEVV